MAQLPCIGLSWPLTKPPFGSCHIYFHYGVLTLKTNREQMKKNNRKKGVKYGEIHAHDELCLEAYLSAHAESKGLLNTIM